MQGKYRKVILGVAGAVSFGVLAAAPDPTTAGRCAVHFPNKARYAWCVTKHVVIDLAKLVGIDIASDEVKKRTWGEEQKDKQGDEGAERRR